jgi:hypothetical protein
MGNGHNRLGVPKTAANHSLCVPGVLSGDTNIFVASLRGKAPQVRDRFAALFAS